MQFVLPVHAPGTLTDPEVASVDMAEEAARSAGIDVATGTATVPKTARRWIHKAGKRAWSRSSPMSDAATWSERP